ncbi:hypothetical protein GCM10019016_099330 [Streptomyces prasinosporus]|uniref:ATP-binding protein n=1 Tax=Streptomyces prasinosporus TaxID=68256 RepID=A0ABP6U7C2_9ACTN
MTNTHRVLAALALTAALLTTAGAAHADTPDSTGGQATDQAGSAAAQEGGNGLLGKAGEVLAPVTGLLDLNT